MMKKITFLLSLGALVMMPLLSASAQTADDKWFCNYTPPKSCFTAQSSHKEIRKMSTSGPSKRPDHCPNGYIKDLKPGSKVLQNVCDKIFESKETECTVVNLQIELGKQKNCKDKDSCYPLGEQRYEEYKDGAGVGQYVQCQKKFFEDGLYGICTREAVRRYAEHLKVTTTSCDTAPALTIVGKDETTEGEAWDATVTASGGRIHTWLAPDDKKSFEILKTTEENIKLADIVISGDAKGCNIGKKEWPKSMNLNEKDQITFMKENEKCVLNALGKVVLKPLLTAKGERELKIKALGDPDPNGPKDPNILSCNQLLPKYLVGANCGEELHGDARDITYWIQRFGKQITTFIAGVAVLLIAWNAFGLVMAGGDSDKIATAKKALIWVGAGLLLTVFAYVIVKTAISLTFLQ